jgi:hypothetical protein
MDDLEHLHCSVQVAVLTALIATRASIATLLPLSAVSLGKTTSAFSLFGDARSSPGFAGFVAFRSR